MPRRRHFRVATTYKARKVPVRTRRPKMTQEEKRAKARAYYHAHKTTINEKRRAKRTSRRYGVTGGRIGPAAPRRRKSRKAGPFARGFGLFKR